MNAAHPLAVAATVRDRPDPRNTRIPIYLGDLGLTAECTVTGRFRPAVTQADPLQCYPAESPEVEVLRLWLSGPWRDVSDLLADSRIAEDIDEKVMAALESEDR